MMWWLPGIAFGQLAMTVATARVLYYLDRRDRVAERGPGSLTEKWCRARVAEDLWFGFFWPVTLIVAGFTGVSTALAWAVAAKPRRTPEERLLIRELDVARREKDIADMEHELGIGEHR